LNSSQSFPASNRQLHSRLGRVGAGGCPPTPPSEPYVKVSLHTAQALIRPVSVERPARKAQQRRSRHQAAWQYASVVVTRCASLGNSTQDASTDGCRSSFAFLVSNGSSDFPAISDQTDVGISGALHTGIGFFGPPNAAAPDPPCGKVCPARTGRAGSVSMFHNNPE
jgi:hypothetical protein